MHHMRSQRGFTLIELLVSMAVLAILMLLVSSVLSQVQIAWGRTAAKVSQFRESRRAFDVLKTNLGQALLNTYTRYEFNNPGNPASPFDGNGKEIPHSAPSKYVLYSELQFRSGPTSELVPAIGQNSTQGHAVFFQAPLGYSGRFTSLPTALNPRGYYIKFDSDASFRPPFLDGRVEPKFRYRLMEYAPPTERNLIYDKISENTQSDWFRNEIDVWSRPIADNVVTLIISPKRPLVDNSGDPRDIAPQYEYDSAVPMGFMADVGNPQAHVLPPEIEVVMVVIDEGSAVRLAEQNGGSAPLQLAGFTSASDRQFRTDLEAMEATLVNAKVNFRIFSATVTMRNSKWNG